MRAPFAEWRGENLPNKTKGQMYAHKGLVVHIIGAGTLVSADNWFHNPAAEASAHFGIRKDGHLVQWVGTGSTAWAEAAGNHYWLSVEMESVGEELTQAQVETAARLFAWLHKKYGFHLQLTSDVNREGLGHHSMGGAEWGNHLMCPGNRVINQKPDIVHRARALLDAPVEEQEQREKIEPPKVILPAWYSRALRFTPGAPLLTGDDVKYVQRKLRVQVDGFFGPNTAKKVRGFQTTHDLPVDGVVGPRTAKEIG